MSKAKYQLLSKTDQTPAMEVNLTAPVSHADDHMDSSVTTTNQLAQSPNALTEINLNDETTANTLNEPQNNLNESPTLNSSSVAVPPVSELPSYNEALRLKKIRMQRDTAELLRIGTYRRDSHRYRSR